jgi:hypothetical protein
MKDPCGLNSDPRGRSYPVTFGGFAVFMAGYAQNGSTSSYDVDAYYWTSSSANAVNAWSRGLRFGAGDVYRQGFGRSSLFSVRCKKD